MKYDFETSRPRFGMEAMKWDEMGNQPEDVVPLSVADMELLSPPEIIEELKKTAEFGMWGYTWWGKRYGEAMRHWMSTRHNWEIDPSWIVQLNGVVQGLYAAVRAFSNPGDGVLIVTPVYYPFYRAIRLNGREVIESPLRLVDGRYEVDFEDFEEKVKKAKIFLLCNPHNPVGRVWTEEELRRMGDICLKNNVLVVSDEIHFDLIMPGYTHTVFTKAVPEMENRTVICTAPSKTFNIAGMQTSNIIIANPEMREAFRKELHGSPSFLGFRACEAAYRGAEPWLDECLEVIQKNSGLVDSFLKEHLPWAVVSPLEGTYLKWVDFTRSGLSKEELEERLA